MFNVPIPVPQPQSLPCTKVHGETLCKILYHKLKDHGYFPALTGGLLYKEGDRKDIDIVIFRHRQMHDSFDMVDIDNLLKEVGIEILAHHGFVTKAKWCGMTVDLFNPEAVDGKYGDN